MRTFILSSIVFIISIISFDYSESKVCPTPAKIVNPESKWQSGSIYEISFSNGCPILKDTEVLLSEPLREAIEVIRLDNNTSYGDYEIEYKYIEDEDLYVANLIDEFKEL